MKYVLYTISFIILSSGLSFSQSILRPDTLGLGAVYGISVSLKDDIAVVGGGPGFLIPVLSANVHVFTRNQNSWELTSRIVPADSADPSTSLFGWAVGLHHTPQKSYIISGSQDDDGQGTNAGAAYIFELDQNSNSWIQAAKINAESFAENMAKFGASVDIDDDVAIVGAPEKNLTSPQDSDDGTAYIFERESGTGSWILQEELIASDFRAEALFGTAVAVSGNYAIVGAPWADSIQDNARAGAAYIFEKTGNGWEEMAKLIPSDRNGLPMATDEFGFSVDIDGDFAVVGAWGHVVNQTNPSGATVIFQRTNNTWTEVAFLRPSDLIPSGFFGWDVSIEGDVVAIGAYSSTEGRSTYIYKRNGTQWIEQSPKINIQSSGTTIAVSYSNDQLLMGDPGFELGAGNAYVFSGVCTGGVSIDPISEKRALFKIYPNPARDDLFIDGLSEVATVHLFSNLGKSVWVGNINPLEPRVDLRNLPAGIYHLKIQEGRNSASFNVLIRE